MPAKNRKITLLYSGLAAGVVVMLGLVTITPKESRTIALVQGKQLDVPSFVAPNSPKTQHSLIYIAIFAGLIMSGCSVAMLLLCSKRQEELPKERQAYEIDLEKERRILGANAAGQVAVAISAAKMAAEAEIDIYTNDLLTRFEAVAEKSDWVALPEPEKPTKGNAMAEIKAQLDELSVKSREVNQLSAAVIESNSTIGLKIPKLTNYPAVLIYGPQGSGKTFLAEEEIRERKSAGHRVTALDPHAGFYSWRDCEVIGAGMDYAGIDAELADFAAEVKRRYERIRNEPNPQFQPWTFVCDEFTNWASRCKASGDFFQAALSDIRKAKMYALFVSHARTLAGLGEAKGMAATRDASLLEIELFGQIDPETAEAVPKFEALVKLPGQSQSDRKLVKLVKHPEPKNATVDEVSGTQIDTSDSSTGKDYTLPEQDSGNLSNPYRKAAEGLEGSEGLDNSEALNQSLNGFLAEVLAENLPPIFADDFPLKKHERRVQLAKLVITQNLGKQKTIWLLWGVKDGGRNNQRYVDARNMLEKLMGGE